MLLAIDVGNSHTVFGAWTGSRLDQHWRVQTRRARTVDEYGVLLESLLGPEWDRPTGVGPRPVGVVISSVVPPVTQVLVELARSYLACEALVVGPGVQTGMPILYDDPRQVGSDRVVNAIAGYARTGTATIIVDCGTATKFELVSEKGEYCGGAIAPGLGISADALFERAARLYRVELTAPRQVVGRNTVHAIQSGLVYGYAAMIDGMVARIRREAGSRGRVVATGGYAALLAPHCGSIDEVDPLLTLDGLRLVYERNTQGPGA